MGVHRGGTRRELVRVAFADDDRARFFQLSHALGIRCRHVIREETRPLCREDARGIDDVLDADRHAVQRAAVVAALNLTFRLCRVLTGLVRAHGDERVELGVQGLDLPQMRVHHFARGDFFLLDLLGKLMY